VRALGIDLVITVGGDGTQEIAAAAGSACR
jgi:6-phosphofructokinase